MSALKPVLRYMGSKARIASWIIRHFPPHRVYIEPFAGSLSVLLAKPRSPVELVNDRDGRVVNFWRVLRDEPEPLIRAVALTPWARDEYALSDERSEDPVEDARRFLVRCWQSVGSMTGTRSGWKGDHRANRPAGCVWQGLPDRLVLAARRLHGVQIENRPAVELIERKREQDHLLYVDPPYPLGVRTRHYYAEEMSEADHEALLSVLSACRSFVLVSSYENPLYGERLASWRRFAVSAWDTSANEREEFLWLNPAATEALEKRLPGLEAL